MYASWRSRTRTWSGRGPWPRRFAVPKVVADYRELHDCADGILIALPNFLHAPAAIDFLRRGTPVLVEKPMALSVADAGEMIRAAGDGNTVLAAAW